VRFVVVFLFVFVVMGCGGECEYGIVILWVMKDRGVCFVYFGIVFVGLMVM